MSIALKKGGVFYNISPLNLIIAVTLLQLIITLLSNGFVLSFDESMWHYIGRNWFRHGLVPYNGGADNKSPFIFAIFGLSDLLFGVNYWFPRVIGALCQSVGIFYVYKITNKLAGPRAGKLVIPFYGLSLLWHATGAKYVAFTETFEVMFLIIAFYKYLTAQTKTDVLISGLTGGLAADFRLTAFFGILAIIIISLSKKQFKNTWLFVLGLAGGVLILITLCFLAGIDLNQLLINGLTDNFGKGSATAHSSDYKINNLLEKFIYSPMILFYPLLVAYVFLKKRIDLWVLWCAFSFAAISIIGIFDVVHLKDILPPLAIINAIALATLFERYLIVFSFNILVFAAWLLFFPSLSEPFANFRILLGAKEEKAVYGTQPYINPSEGDRKLLGKWIRDHTKSSDLVFAHSYGTQVQAYSERISPTIYFSVTQTPLAKTRLRKDLTQHKPAMILIPMFPEYVNQVDLDTRQFVSSILAKDYYLDRSLYNYQVFRIKSR